MRHGQRSRRLYQPARELTKHRPTNRQRNACMRTRGHLKLGVGLRIRAFRRLDCAQRVIEQSLKSDLREVFAPELERTL